MVNSTGLHFNKHIITTNLEAGIESVQLFDIEKLNNNFYNPAGTKNTRDEK